MNSFKLVPACAALWCALQASGATAGTVTALAGGPGAALSAQFGQGSTEYSFDQVTLDDGWVDQYLSNGGPRPTGNAILPYKDSALKFIRKAGLSIGGSEGSVVKLEQGSLTDSLNGRVLFGTTGTVDIDLISPVASATFDQDNGLLLSVATNSTFTWSEPAISGNNTQIGRNISFSNLNIDFQTRTVSAFVSGQSNGGTTLAPQTLTLFSFSEQEGISRLPMETLRGRLSYGLSEKFSKAGWTYIDSMKGLGDPTLSIGLVGWGKVSGLKLSEEGQAALIQALGLDGLQKTTLGFAAADFGGIDFGLGVRMAGFDIFPSPYYPENPTHRYSVFPVKSIPEPGTWALMALGLLALPLAARRTALSTR